MTYTLDSPLYHTFGDQIHFLKTEVHPLLHIGAHLPYFFLYTSSIVIVISLLQSAPSLQQMYLMERYETTNYRCKRPSHTLSSDVTFELILPHEKIIPYSK